MSAPSLREVIAKLEAIRAAHAPKHPQVQDRCDLAIRRLSNAATKRRMTVDEHRAAAAEARFGNYYFEPTTPDLDAALTIEAIALAIYNATPVAKATGATS